MSVIPKPMNKSDTKPVYVVTILNASSGKSKFTYIKTRQDLFNMYDHHIDVRGVVISKEIAEKLKNKKIEDRELEGEQVHLMIAHHQWINAQNVSFNGIAK